MDFSCALKQLYLDRSFLDSSHKHILALYIYLQVII